MRYFDAERRTETKKTLLCSSADMGTEEIRLERERSGWNPYLREEEPMQPSNPIQPVRAEQPDELVGPPPIMPFFVHPDYAQVLEEQKKAEQDLRMLQSMYPKAARAMLPYVEEECDKMEYEGSPMYDEYPDSTTVRSVQERIYEQVKDQFAVPEDEMPDDIFSMQYRGPGRDPRGKNWLDDLARVVLLQEMHHRRCRRRGCRR